MNPPDSTLTDPQRIIAELQRANAELQHELVECKAERDEALDQQTATAEVLEVINASPGDLAPVFEAMLEKAMRLCEAAHGILRTWDGDELALAAIRGEPTFVEKQRQLGPIVVRPGSPMEPLLHGEPLLHVADVANRPALPACCPGLAGGARENGQRWNSQLANRRNCARTATCLG